MIFAFSRQLGPQHGWPPSSCPFRVGRGPAVGSPDSAHLVNLSAQGILLPASCFLPKRGHAGPSSPFLFLCFTRKQPARPSANWLGQHGDARGTRRCHRDTSGVTPARARPSCPGQWDGGPCCSRQVSPNLFKSRQGFRPGIWQRQSITRSSRSAKSLLVSLVAGNRIALTNRPVLPHVPYLVPPPWPPWHPSSTCPTPSPPPRHFSSALQVHLRPPVKKPTPRLGKLYGLLPAVCCPQPLTDGTCSRDWTTACS